MVEWGYCEKHRPQRAPRSRDDRPSSYRRGYGGKEYTEARRLVLERDPVCVRCNEQPSVLPHHDPPFEAIGYHDPALMFGLCRDCHERIHNRKR
jgi:hypothetical protein